MSNAAVSPSVQPMPVGRAGRPSAGVEVDGLGLRFSSNLVALDNIRLEIPGGSFCTLLGPSGSGKTTLLRCIAGLAEPTVGRIAIGGQDVTRLPVQSRNIGFVFQNYALFPHMNVAENVAYPLKLQNYPTDRRDARVREILELIELPHVAARAVGELSGGQQQRVAIGRALSYNPSLLLLDEPMGALDRRLRQQLGSQLREIQQRTGITAVYVTHDQEEAFILSDRVAIMDKGKILQYAPPADLYFRPRSRFVAQFLGEANLLEVEDVVAGADGFLTARTALGPIPVTDDRDDRAARTARTGLALVLRPEQIRLAATDAAEAGFIAPVPVTIRKELFLGSRSLVTVEAAGGTEILVECQKASIPTPQTQSWISWPDTAAILVDH